VRQPALSRGNVRTNVYQVTQTGPTKSFTYDLNGNLTGDGVKTYEWDAVNRLVAVKQGGSTLASFTYDGNGRRGRSPVNC
jgi:YD repeat-containing protein